MIKKAPSLAQTIVMTAFALSCVGLLLFSWISFGGSHPLKPKGWRMHVVVPNAAQLAVQADVRISGVTVGKVVRLRAQPKAGVTDVEVQIQPHFVPRPSDTRVIVRQKSLLGEAYLSMTAGSTTAPPLAEGGTLGLDHVQHAVTLPEVLRTFDPQTRANFRAWMRDQGAALGPSGRALNDALGQLDPFAQRTTDLVRRIDDDGTSVRALIAQGGQALSAVTQEPGRLRALVRSTDAAFAATSRQDGDLAATIRALGPFLDGSRSTLDRLATFSRDATPLTDVLNPGVRALSRVLADVPAGTAPLGRLLSDAPALERASVRGVPASVRVLAETRPFLRRLKPYIGELLPVIGYAASYRRELAATLGNLAAATQSTLPAADGREPLHLLRGAAALNPESLAAFPRRLSTDRTNPFLAPGAYDRLAAGLRAWSTGCGDAAVPTIDPSVSEERRRIAEQIFLKDRPANVACSVQAPLGPTLGQGAQNFPQLTPLP